MLARKVLLKSASLTGAIAAMAVATPASAATLIEINRYAGNNAAATGWGESLGGGMLGGMNWSAIAKGGNAAASAGKSASAPSVPNGFQFNSIVALDAVKHGMGLEGRVGGLPLPALQNANLGQSGNMSILARTANFAGSSETTEVEEFASPAPAEETPIISAASAAPVTAVPEPATWLMLLLGFAFAGSALRLEKARPRTILT